MISASNDLINGMDKATAERYIAVRDKIDEFVDRIYAIGSVLGLLSEAGDDHIKMDALAISTLGKIVATDVCRIIEQLDDHFVYIVGGREGLGGEEV